MIAHNKMTSNDAEWLNACLTTPQSAFFNNDEQDDCSNESGGADRDNEPAAHDPDEYVPVSGYHPKRPERALTKDHTHWPPGRTVLIHVCSETITAFVKVQTTTPLKAQTPPISLDPILRQRRCLNRGYIPVRT